MKKNRILTLVILSVMCVTTLLGCGKSNVNTVLEAAGTEYAEENKGTEKYRIVCTTFPQYDWIREIIGEQSEQFEIILLLDNGVDLHSYQPTAEDIAKIEAADMFVYVGGESDHWVEDALQESKNKKVVNLLDSLGELAKEEEIVEGMQKSEHDEEKNQEEEHSHEEKEAEIDEHIWLSLRNAIALIETLTKGIQEIDTVNAAEYRKNSDVYIEKLSELDKQYEKIVKDASKKTVLFGDRFPFRYLADDYNLVYFAAFVGCSAETEASFETIVFLSEKVNELGLSGILVIENSDQKIAETIKQNTHEKNQKILVMNSLQSVTSKDIKEGITYLKGMKDNLEVLKKALN